MKLKELQKKYLQFVYDKYDYKIKKENLEISFVFNIASDIYFKPKIVIQNIDKKRLKLIEDSTLNNLIFHLGLIEMISYWKATCSPEIIIKAGYLNKNQIKWWQDLIVNGMGEFFYKNKIDWRVNNFLTIKNNLNLNNQFAVSKLPLKERYLVPIGGGKDSIVTLELLKKDEKETRCFSLNPTEAAKKVIKIGECDNPIIVKRKIDKKLLELNQKGFLNGHTPFSAYLAFLTTLIAIMFDYKYIPVSNEKSADEGNVKYLGKIINHQYSKTSKFEKKFQNYSKKYLAENTFYFSYLRKYREIKIAEMFSKYPKYFSVFLSCNVAQKKENIWCRNCSKCLFVYLILYPYLEKKEIIKIFKEDLFEKKELLPIMKALIGESKFKPFECVGTYSESKKAFNLCLKKAKKTGKIPYLFKKIKKM